MSFYISIIMSVKNGEKHLEESIKSILNQTYENFEFLICDDGSNDSSFEICKKYSELDDRVKIFCNKETIGLTKSLNKLISYSKGNIIARQDADDISNPERLSKQLELYKKGFDIVTSRARLYGENKVKPRLSLYFPKKLMIKKKNIFVHGTLFIKKDTLIDIGCYDENFYYAQDYKLFSDLIDEGYKIKTISKPLYTIRNENNISTKNIEEQQHFANLVKKGQKN